MWKIRKFSLQSGLELMTTRMSDETELPLLLDANNLILGWTPMSVSDIEKEFSDGKPHGIWN